MKLLHFIDVIIIIIFTNCTNKNKLMWHCDFTADDFEQIELTVERDGAVLDFTEELFGKPSLLTMLDNNCIAVKDRGNDKMVWLINLDNEEAKSFVARGNGPDELLELTTMSYSDGMLSVAGLNDSKVIDFKVNYDSLNLKLENMLVLPYTQPLRSIHLNDSTIFSLAPPFSGIRYHIYDISDSTCKSLKCFPVDETSIGIVPDNAFFQADLAMNKKINRLVVSNRTWAIIEIWDIDSDKWRIIFGPIPTDAKIIKETSGESSWFRQKPSWDVWDGVYAGENHIYIGYNGSCRKSQDDSISDAQAIYVIDYEGNPCKIYRFNEKLISFTIDEKSGFIYTIQELPERVLVRYPLTK